MARPTPIKLTAMYHQHVAAGATLVERDGWRLAAGYGPVEAELEMVRTACGVCDISPAGKLDVQGADALGLLAGAMSLAEPIEVGRSQRCSIATPDGTIDDVTVCGLSYDEALVLTPPTDVGLAAEALEQQLEGCAHLVDVTSARAGMWLVGPRSPEVLSRLVELDLAPGVFADGRCAQGKAAEVHVLVVRADVDDLLGYQLYVTRDYGEYLWDALLLAGKSNGTGPFGIEALQHLARGA